MKRLILNVAVAVVVVAGLQTASAGTLAGTPHDLSGKGWGTTESCKFCHTPHLAQSVAGAPLWNHQTTASGSFTMYSSSTFKGTVSAAPSATSLMCLSCHDGTVASDSFANAGVLQVGTHFMTSTATNLVGASHNLSGDHPISFDYNAVHALDTAIQTPDSTNYVDAGHTIPLYSGKLECSSCHSVHDNTIAKFLRVDNASSALCLKCHIK